MGSQYSAATELLCLQILDFAEEFCAAECYVFVRLSDKDQLSYDM